MSDKKAEKKIKTENSSQKRKALDVVCDATVPDEYEFTDEDVKLYTRFQDTKLSDYKFDFPDENKTLYTSKLILASHCECYGKLFATDAKATGETIKTSPCKQYLIALSILHRFNTGALSQNDAYAAYKLFVDWGCDLGQKLCGNCAGINPEMVTKFPILYSKNLNSANLLPGWTIACPFARLCVDSVLQNLKAQFSYYSSKDAFNAEIDKWRSCVAKI